jgi:hypothetical protein
MSSPRRAVGTLALLASVSLAAGAVTPVVAGSVAPAAAAPAPDCAVAFPIADLAVGARLDGLTVTRGTTPEGFTADVLGVLTDGIAPGVDMIMVKVDPATLDIDPSEVKGIWQGMSGSPLYAADGRLVGAVSYGLGSFEQSWVAGVTPYADMTEYLADAPAARPAETVRVDGRTARRVAAVAGTRAQRVSAGFRQLPLPLGVAGVAGSAQRLLHPSAQDRRKHPWVVADTYVLGRASAAATTDPADTIVAGGNVAGATAYGDVTTAGLGTATSVCGGKVVGFGHPMAFAGRSTLTLHPAEALYVQGDSPSFKVANIGPAVGTVYGDHLTGITGAFGALPPTTTVRSTVVDGARQRTGTTQVSLRSADSLAMTTYLQNGANTSRVRDAMGAGSELLTWTIAGTDARGRAFDLSWTDRYLATFDLAEEVAMALGDVVYTVAAQPGVRVDEVTTTGRLSPETGYYRLKRLEQRRAGAWSPISNRTPAIARAGGRLAIRAVFRGPDGVRLVPFRFQVPRGAAHRVAFVNVVGGLSQRLHLGNSIAQSKAALREAVRSDAVRAQFGRRIGGLDLVYTDDEPLFRGADHGPGDKDGKGGQNGKDGKDGPGLVKFAKTKTSAPQPELLDGSRSAIVMIR